MERMLGWNTLQRIMSTFFDRYKFKHPRPADFFAVANEVGRQDLTWFFDEVHRGSNAFDYAVTDLRSRRGAPRGIVDRDGGRAFSEGGGDSGDWHTEVVVRRLGEAVFPVDVLVTLEDGQHVRQRWDGRDRWRALTFTTKAEARSAQVDPERVLLLDVDYTNNSRTTAPRGGEAATKWSLKWLVWLQDLMLTYGFFV